MTTAIGAAAFFMESDNHAVCNSLLGIPSGEVQQCLIDSHIYAGGAFLLVAGIVLLVAGLAWSKPQTEGRPKFPAGYYPDPGGFPGRFRWFDGRAWTENIIDKPPNPESITPNE